MTMARISPPVSRGSHCCSKVSCLRALSLRPKLGVNDVPVCWMQNGVNSNDGNHDSCVLVTVTLMTISVLVLVGAYAFGSLDVWQSEIFLEQGLISPCIYIYSDSIGL